MAKFHISNDGLARPCRVPEGVTCPLGSEVPHTEVRTQEAANRWAEKVNEEVYGGSFSVTLSKREHDERVRDIEHYRFDVADSNRKAENARADAETSGIAAATTRQRIETIEARIGDLRAREKSSGPGLKDQIRFEEAKIKGLVADELKPFEARNREDLARVAKHEKKASEHAEASAKMIREYGLDLELTEQEQLALDRATERDQARAESPVAKLKSIFGR